jgi:hypothetical protein
LEEKVGIICASEVLANTDDENLNELAEATGLGKSELKVLMRSLQSALNIRLVIRFRWRSSLDEVKKEKAEYITIPQV